MVKYALDNPSQKLVCFFKLEVYILWICAANNVILIPINLQDALKYEVVLAILHTETLKVSVAEDGLNDVIAITTATDTIRLTSQQKVLSA